MIAVSIDNLLFFLLIAVAALFQLLSKAINKAGKKNSNETPGAPGPQTPRPIQRAPRESDADRIRKFLEALGQPPSSTPPPPVLPRTDIPPRRLAPVQPPPVIPGMRRLPQKQEKTPDIRQSESVPGKPPGLFPEIVPPPVTSAFEVQETLPVEVQQSPTVTTPIEAYAFPKAFEVANRADSKMDIVTLLASKSSLREAILLREILGTPRGLQAFDLL